MAMKTRGSVRQGLWLGMLMVMAVALTGPGQQVKAKKKKTKGTINQDRKREMMINPDEMPEDFGKLREEIQSEWARRRAEIQAEIEAERQEIIRLLGDERRAIQVLWGEPIQTSLDQFELDPAFKTQVTYKDGYIKATSVVVADSPAELDDAEKKCQQHATAVLDQEIRKLKPTNGASVADELKKADSRLDEKKLDQFVTTAGKSRVEGVVDLPEGKKGVKVSVEVPMADPEEPSLSQVLEPMIAEPEDDADVVGMKVTPGPSEPAFDADSWVAGQGDINGLIVDTRGTGFEPCLFPRLMSTNNSGYTEAIYYTEGMSNTQVGKMGVVGWARSVEAANTEPRLTPGELYKGKPLVLEKSEVEDTVENKIVLKPGGSAKIKVSDKKYQYLDHARVVVVVE